MALLEQVQAMCERLSPKGWGPLMAAHGLDITADDLHAELSKTLPAVNRSVPGFEDFALEGVRGVEPGDPARSLLFHAFASPSVTTGADAVELGAFPTSAELEVLENYVYGVRPPSMAELLTLSHGHDVAIVVFATQYRPSFQTPHQRHADVCFARTGIARTGTGPAVYDGRLRGFTPVAPDAHEIRVLPATYGVYLAVLAPGDQASFVPMRFLVPDGQAEEKGDQARNFWLPIHKLFSGQECIRAMDLHIQLRVGHVNEKLRRIHLSLGQNASWHEPDISQPPFRFTDGIAELSADPTLATGTLMPVPHHRLVEPAEYQGVPLTFEVHPNTPLSSSFNIPAEGLLRHGPEYVHVRTKVTDAGEQVDLNEQADVEAIVAAGGYRALHYLDFTGDGWVTPVVPELAVAIPRSRSAYSLVAAPDFFPSTDQRTLSEWAATRVPTTERQAIWRVPPDPLSDQRFPANLELPGGSFRADEDTVTAIVSLARNPAGEQTGPVTAETFRHSHLPDDAAGVFAPGWDVSVDGGSGAAEHLAAYGLGSPFPEDSKLCAALSSFWPAVAPDAARTFEPSPAWPTVIPLSDEEIGVVGDLPWDGVPGPTVVQLGDVRVAEYTSLAHADYVLNALANRFTLTRTAAIDDVEYESRVLAMIRVYQALGVRLDQSFSDVVRNKARWTVLSFRRVETSDSSIEAAEAQAGVSLQLPAYRFEVFLRGAVQPHPSAVGKVRVRMLRSVQLFVDPTVVLMQDSDGLWRQAG
jgi:hypothetical protein